MPALFQNILSASFHGSIVILAVMLLRLVLRKAPKKFICWLWALAGIRLLMPIHVQSSLSLQPEDIALPDLTAFRPWLRTVWAVLAVGIILYSVISYIHLRRKVADAVKVPGGYESDKIETAFVLGFVHPKIYIPADMPQADRAQILAHERTHLDKGDHWIKLLGFAALALHWFNPLVWCAYILLCKDIEMACDQRVVAYMDLEERKAYSSALLRCSTQHVHYAACPVAFGEVSVKYRIKSVLSYRKPGFWICLSAGLAIAFVALCLGTNPARATANPEESLGQLSAEPAEEFTPAALPDWGENPDWGLHLYFDPISASGGNLVYLAEERLESLTEIVHPKEVVLDKWNGESWEPLTGLTTQPKISPVDWDFSPTTMEILRTLDWSAIYGNLPAGDYRLRQVIETDTDSAEFSCGFHIYVQKLPTAQENAVSRCQNALDNVGSAVSCAVSLTWQDSSGTPVPTWVYYLHGDSFTGNQSVVAKELRLGDTTLAGVYESSDITVPDWKAFFRLDGNRQILFPQGDSQISDQEVRFRSVWTDIQGRTCRGTDSFTFLEDGTLAGITKVTETVNTDGSVSSETLTLDVDYHPVWKGLIPYQDGNYDVDPESGYFQSWQLYFQMDDDSLTHRGATVYFFTDKPGRVDYRTDGNYWLEKKTGLRNWTRLGSEALTGSLGEYSVRSTVSAVSVDWSNIYGELEPGVYRMGLRFYSGEEETILYSEFRLYAKGGAVGEGGDAALARLDKAVATLQESDYSARYFTNHPALLSDDSTLQQVIWKTNGTQITEFYSQGTFRFSETLKPDDFGYNDFMNFRPENDAYTEYCFIPGYCTVSSEEISFFQVYPSTGSSVFYRYRLDDFGRIQSIERIFYYDDLTENPSSDQYEIEYPDKSTIQEAITRNN